MIDEKKTEITLSMLSEVALATAHDAKGKFTSGGGGGASFTKAKLGRADGGGKQSVAVDGKHVGHVTKHNWKPGAKDGPTQAHHVDGKTTDHKSLFEAVQHLSDKHHEASKSVARREERDEWASKYRR